LIHETTTPVRRLAKNTEDSGGNSLPQIRAYENHDNQTRLKTATWCDLIEDFILREKITHFDHERIPERVVHARGSAAHGYFSGLRIDWPVYKSRIPAGSAVKTPVFVRFSTVAGSRGSTDLARDVRGFAVKFYTEERKLRHRRQHIPVFFIQDAN